MGKFIDLTGQRFGKWLVVSRAGRAEKYRMWWSCICDCGGKKDVDGRYLESGRSYRCRACANREKNNVPKVAGRTGELEEIRAALNLSAAAVAKIIGVNDGTIRRALREGRGLKHSGTIRKYNKSNIGPKIKVNYVQRGNKKQSAAVTHCGYCGSVVICARYRKNQSKSGLVFCNRSHATFYQHHGPKPPEAAPQLTENLEQRYTAKPGDLWVGMEKTLDKARGRTKGR